MHHQLLSQLKNGNEKDHEDLNLSVADMEGDEASETDVHEGGSYRSDGERQGEY